jgi:purine-cytosine permease-like protein
VLAREQHVRRQAEQGLLDLLGIIVQAPFVVTTLYTGPVGSALGGVDLSWIAGLIVVTPVYYVAARRFRRRVTPTAGLVMAAPGQPT